MKIWAFVSQKGGSGKTTLATHLAVYAEQKGETVALIDLDPQASAVAWHGIRNTDAPVVIAGSPDKLPALIETARGLGVTLAMIDTAPHTDRGALVAIRAADLVIMPVRPSFLDVAALVNTVQLLEAADKKDSAIAVLNAVPPRGSLVDEAYEALQAFGVAIADQRIAQRNPIANAIPQGKGVTEFAPKDAASDEIKALWKRLVAAGDDAPKQKTKTKAPAKDKRK